LGDKRSIALAIHNLGEVAYYQGDYKLGAVLLKECLSLAKELGEKAITAATLDVLGLIARDEGNLEQAATLLRASLEQSQEIGERESIAHCLEGLAGTASDQDEPRRAARLFGAAEVLREVIGAPLPPTDRANYDRHVTAVHAGLEAVDFAAAWAEGRAMTIKQAVEYALGLGTNATNDLETA
jgi:tetratricopeptide (TPR) repeat protein